MLSLLKTDSRNKTYAIDSVHGQTSCAVRTICSRLRSALALTGSPGALALMSAWRAVAKCLLQLVDGLDGYLDLKLGAPQWSRPPLAARKHILGRIADKIIHDGS